MTPSKLKKHMGWGVGLMPLFALMAPFGIWAIAQVLPYRILLDEGFKAFMVSVVIGRMEKRVELYLLVMCGILFAGSKLVLHMLGALQAGLLGVSWWQLALVVPMQVATILLLWWGWRQNYSWLGFLGAVALHAGFNAWVGW